MGGYGFKLLRVLAGAPVLVGVVLYMRKEMWVRDASEVKAQAVLCCVAALLVVSGVLGSARLFSRRWRGLPDEVGWGAGFLFFLLTLGVSLPIGLGTAFLGRVMNVRTAEAWHWTNQGLREEADVVRGYLEWAEGDDEEYFGRKHDIAALQRRHREFLDLPYDDPRRDSMQREVDATRDAVDRYHQARRADGGWFLREFTPLNAHLVEAEQRFDDLSYAEAVAKKSATALREYRAAFPQGRHAEEARAALRARYAEAEARYLDMVTKSEAEDAQAVAGVKALLTYLREHDLESPVVPVCFLPVEGLEGEKIEAVIRAETGSEKVVAVSPAFTPQRNASRHGAVVDKMNTALRWVVGDLFQLVERDAKELADGPRFLVRYVVSGTGDAYSRKSEDALPVPERTFFVGIAFAFDFTLQVPGHEAELDLDPTKGFRFAVQAKPAPEFSVMGEGDAWTVYETMASTAFDDFAGALARGYGLAPQGQ
jgi:hypothetical protein